MHQDFLKPYDHNAVENDIYAAWEKSGYFAPQMDVDKKTGTNQRLDQQESAYCIIMPPPNANGSLHVGHAVMIAVEDILIRYWRLRGKNVLWLPGADHAGFETQVVFEKKLEKEGTSRFEILNQEGGREKFYQMVWNFTQAHKSGMESQVRRLGASCDWSKELFTLDPRIVAIVYGTFKKLYDDGLVYRDKRIVNFCVKHQTSLSDLEVAWEDRTDALYHVRYALADNGARYITIATTRPETIPGDTAVAVNPTDARYNNFVGKEVIEPITGRRIPIIADEAVDVTFGTGALKITPAHDAVDFEVGKRHHLETRQTIDANGRFNDLAGPFAGMKVPEARQKAAEILAQNGALEKTEPYQHQVGVCYKCRNIVEPMILPQWFVDLTKKGKEKIVAPVIDAVKSGTTKITPDFQEKIFFHWMENIHDWNISRQITWGIPIPVWYCQDCGKETVHIADGAPAGCAACGSKNLKKDTDVFDTWFSSGQWPFAALLAQNGSKENSKNQNAKITGTKEEEIDYFKTFYPTAMMETGYDILFFWVARMMMLGLYVTGQVPFKDVYLHGLVRDKDKQKMSKSKGNVVDPLGVVEQYGADALRMALIVGNSPGQDVTYDENKVRGYRNFSNKLWNIARFVIAQIDADSAQINADDIKLTSDDQERVAAFKKTKMEVADNIEKLRFSQAAETAYHYVWHTFADVVIEEEKKILADATASEKQKQSARATLAYILRGSLVMLHPFMPFVTEAIYQRLPAKNKEFLMVESWN